MAYASASTIERADGAYRGEFRAPVNIAAHRVGSIHDDSRALELGFEGGLVSGLVHNEQYPPLGVAAFGQAFFERGCYSMYYRTPTVQGELVRAAVQAPGLSSGPIQVQGWSETEDGRRVSEGTIGLGDTDEPTALEARLANQQHSDPRELRILRDARPGEALGEKRIVNWPLENQLNSRHLITEPMDWYFDDSPWGGPIASSLALYRLMRARTPGDGVQVDGGIEVRYLNGPVFLDRDYLFRARTLAVGETPKTEYLWFESTLTEPADEKLIARKLMMCRWMKESSPLYR